jgi:hypothetical protein
VDLGVACSAGSVGRGGTAVGSGGAASVAAAALLRL